MVQEFGKEKKFTFGNLPHSGQSSSTNLSFGAGTTTRGLSTQISWLMTMACLLRLKQAVALTSSGIHWQLVTKLILMLLCLPLTHSCQTGIYQRHGALKAPMMRMKMMSMMTTMMCSALFCESVTLIMIMMMMIIIIIITRQLLQQSS